MRSLRVRMLVPFVLLGLGAAAWSACKQEEGERCQIDSDCADGLQCNRATQQCAQTSAGGIDASIPIDAPDAATTGDATIDATIDASTIDAMIDAPPDA